MAPGVERAMCISEGPRAGDAHPQGLSPPEHTRPASVQPGNWVSHSVWYEGGVSHHAPPGREPGLFDFVLFLGCLKFFLNFEVQT